MTILVLLLATVLIPEFFKERWLKVLNSHVTLKLKCSGPTGRAEAKESQRRSDGNQNNAKTLTTGQYFTSL